MRFIVLFLTLLSSIVFADETVLRYSKLTETEEATAYIKEILQLVWESTKEEGAVTLKPSRDEMVQDRALQNLRIKNDIDLFWTMTSKEREKDLRVIRFPLLKGMLGYRVFIINKKKQYLFDQIKEKISAVADIREKNRMALKELRSISMGQGHDWPDTKILENANFMVVKSSNYKSLFRMIKIGRFVAFPRGVNEPWREIENDLNSNFDVEQHFCLAYPAPLYLMVNKVDEKLALRIERGLDQILKNGSFEKVFNKYWKKYLERARIENRIIVWIDNPLLSEETKKSIETDLAKDRLLSREK